MDTSTISHFCECNPLLAVIICNFTRNKWAFSLLCHILLQCAKFCFSFIHAFLLFWECGGGKFVGEGEEGLDIIYWTTALCEMWNTDGVVKRINPAVTAILHPGVPPCFSKPQTFTNTKPLFAHWRYYLTVHPLHFVRTTQPENMINIPSTPTASVV
jgi:hypothetical protein